MKSNRNGETKNELRRITRKSSSKQYFDPLSSHFQLIYAFSNLSFYFLIESFDQNVREEPFPALPKRGEVSKLFPFLLGSLKTDRIEQKKLLVFGWFWGRANQLIFVSLVDSFGHSFTEYFF